MKDLVLLLVKEIVANKDAVEINESTDNSVVNLTIHVDEADMGAVIGKNGKVINAIRTIARARATLENVKVYVEIDDSSR